MEALGWPQETPVPYSSSGVPPPPVSSDPRAAQSRERAESWVVGPEGPGRGGAGELGWDCLNFCLHLLGLCNPRSGGLKRLKQSLCV